MSRHASHWVPSSSGVQGPGSKQADTTGEPDIPGIKEFENIVSIKHAHTHARTHARTHANIIIE